MNIITKHERYYQSVKDPADQLKILLAERDLIILTLLKTVEIIQNHGQKLIFDQVKADKYALVENFIAINHNWTEKNIPHHHTPTRLKDGRSGKKESNGGIDCLECKKNYDPWQAVCPRCAALAEKKYKAIEAENNNLKSFFNLIIGE